jgi:hypothetical protein
MGSKTESTHIKLESMHIKTESTHIKLVFSSQIPVIYWRFILSITIFQYLYAIKSDSTLGIKQLMHLFSAFTHLAKNNMTIPTIDATLTQQDIDEVVAELKNIRDRLSFLIGLSVQERRQIPKMGRKSQSFAVRALDMAAQHNDVMPRHLNIEEARRDLALYESLNPILQAVSHLRELLEDTQMLAGSEAYAAARLAYNAAKVSGKNLGLDDIIDDLSQQFRRARKV